MPVQTVRRKPTLQAAIARLGADLLANHITQQLQTFAGASILCLGQLVVYQTMECAHRRVALQLTADIYLRRLQPLLRLDNLSQHQLCTGASVLINTAAQKSCQGAGCSSTW